MRARSRAPRASARDDRRQRPLHAATAGDGWTHSSPGSFCATTLARLRAAEWLVERLGLATPAVTTGPGSARCLAKPKRNRRSCERRPRSSIAAFLSPWETGPGSWCSEEHLAHPPRRPYWSSTHSQTSSGRHGRATSCRPQKPVRTRTRGDAWWIPPVPIRTDILGPWMVDGNPLFPKQIPGRTDETGVGPARQAERGMVGEGFGLVRHPAVVGEDRASMAVGRPLGKALPRARRPA